MPVLPDWPAPNGAPAILFGGTFDPPHIGHTAMATAARRDAMPDGAWLVLVPAARSPHKSVNPSASGEQRAEMLAHAFAGVEHAAVWTEELERALQMRGQGAQPCPAGPPAGESYWIDTLTAAAARTTGGLRFLIGADQAVSFHRWHRARDILDLAPPVVVLRDPIRDAGALRARLAETGFWSDDELDRWASWAITAPLIDASATDARAALARGDHRRAEALLGAAVAGYVIECGCYAD